MEKYLGPTKFEISAELFFIRKGYAVASASHVQLYCLLPRTLHRFTLATLALSPRSDPLKISPAYNACSFDGTWKSELFFHFHFHEIQSFSTS